MPKEIIKEANFKNLKQLEMKNFQEIGSKNDPNNNKSYKNSVLENINNPQSETFLSKTKSSTTTENLINDMTFINLNTK